MTARRTRLTQSPEVPRFRRGGLGGAASATVRAATMEAKMTPRLWVWIGTLDDKLTDAERALDEAREEQG